MKISENVGQGGKERKLEVVWQNRLSSAGVSEGREDGVQASEVQTERLQLPRLHQGDGLCQLPLLGHAEK